MYVRGVSLHIELCLFFHLIQFITLLCYFGKIYFKSNGSENYSTDLSLCELIGETLSSVSLFLRCTVPGLYWGQLSFITNRQAKHLGINNQWPQCEANQLFPRINICTSSYKLGKIG